MNVRNISHEIFFLFQSMILYFDFEYSKYNFIILIFSKLENLIVYMFFIKMRFFKILYKIVIP